MADAGLDRFYTLSEHALNKARAADNPDAALNQAYEKTNQLFGLFEPAYFMHTNGTTSNDIDVIVSQLPDQIDALIAEGADINALDWTKQSIAGTAINSQDARVLDIVMQRGAIAEPAVSQFVSDLDKRASAALNQTQAHDEDYFIPFPQLKEMIFSMFKHGHARIAPVAGDGNSDSVITFSDLDFSEGSCCIVDKNGKIKLNHAHIWGLSINDFFVNWVKKTKEITKSYAAINSGAKKPAITPQDLIQLYVDYTNHDETVLKCLSENFNLTLQALEHVPSHIAQEYTQLLSRENTAFHAKHTIAGPAKDWSALIHQGEGMRV